MSGCEDRRPGYGVGQLGKVGPGPFNISSPPVPRGRRKREQLVTDFCNISPSVSLLNSMAGSFFPFPLIAVSFLQGE